LALCLITALWGGSLPQSEAAAPNFSAPDRLGGASAWDGINETQARLLSASTATGAESTLALGLQFHMQKDWKIYWRSPGDAGYPPTLDWSGSENFSEAGISWPAPIRFSVLGFETVGYHDDVVLPITVTLARPGEPASLRLAVNYLTCSTICVPAMAHLSLDIPAGAASPSEFAGLIQSSIDRVPGDGAKAGLAIEKVESGGTTKHPALEITARARDAFSAPDLFVEGSQTLRFGPPKSDLSDSDRLAHISIPVSAVPGAPLTLAGSDVTLTLVDGDRSAEYRSKVVPGAILPDAPPESSLAEFLAVLGFGVLGGLILNLMPCVLPVLSIKLLSVIDAGGRERRAARLGFLASAAGIIASFFVLAGVLAAFKAAGYAIGWGVQFQHPGFLTLMILLLTLFACNLWGWFEFRLPGWLGDVAGRSSDGRTLLGNFATGAFVTVLATPCSAPFLGTAIGFALARGPSEIFAIFAALGLGLSLPYLAVAAVPGLTAHLPKPGHWMISLRKILGLALVATAIWLLAVLALQTSVAAAILAGLTCVAIAGTLALRGALLGDRALLQIGLVSGLSILAFLPALLVPERRDAPAEAAATGLWQDFNLAAIPNLVATGKVVLVDVTAEWCLTCKANEALVLSKPAVAGMIDGRTILGMRADWTKKDDAIAAYLAGFGRYGIPFNAVYGPGAPAGIVLPELLSEKAVLDAFARAKGGNLTPSAADKSRGNG